MRTSTGKPTKAQERRFRQLQDMGCIVCSLFFGAYRAPDIHHILSGGRRRGHDFTLPLCPEHHRLPTGYYGPSLAGGTRAFEKAWGTQEELLAKVNEALA